MRSSGPVSPRWVLGGLIVGVAILVFANRAPPTTTRSEGTEPMTSGAADAACGRRLPVIRSGAVFAVSYCANRDLSRRDPDPSVRHAVIVVHGDARNAADYYGFASVAA